VMQLRCLLVGLDEVTARIMRGALTKMSIRTEYVTYAGAAERVQKGRYEAIVLFYDETPNANDMVQRIRSGVSNRDAVIFLLSTITSQQHAFRVRANFFINPPVTEDSVVTTFKAAYGLLVRSRARWHREPVNGTAYLNLGLTKNVAATILNLSQGGMLFKSTQMLRPQQMILVRFGLPSTDELLCVSAQVVWTRADGVSGIRFADVPEPTQKVLRQWVEDRLELAKVYANFRERTGTGAVSSIAQ
jgi:PilZ domain-containing protein